jgi:hypothetical protein
MEKGTHHEGAARFLRPAPEDVMTTTEALPLRLFAGKVRLAEEAVESRRVASAEALTAPEAEFLVADVLALAQDARRLWSWVWARGEADEIRDFDATGAFFDDHFGRLLRLAETARTASGQAGRDVAGLAELEGALPEWRTWVERALAAWPRPAQCRSPVDPERIARAREALDRGEGEDIEDILARLAAGGPLVKE